MQLLHVHYPERVHAREYLTEWIGRTTTAGLSLPRDLLFLRLPQRAEIVLSDFGPRALATGEVPARLVTVQRRKRPHQAAQLPTFAVWLQRRQMQGVTPERARQEWNGFALINGLLPP